MFSNWNIRSWNSFLRYRVRHIFLCLKNNFSGHEMSFNRVWNTLKPSSMVPARGDQWIRVNCFYNSFCWILNSLSNLYNSSYNYIIDSIGRANNSGSYSKSFINLRNDVLLLISFVLLSFNIWYYSYVICSTIFGMFYWVKNIKKYINPVWRNIFFWILFSKFFNFKENMQTNARLEKP